MYGKMQESGLTEIFPLICTSALWGHTILFSQMEFPFLRAHCREWLQSDGCWKWKSLSHVWLFSTPWIYSPWNSPGQNPGVGSLPGDLPNPGIEPRSPTLQVDSLSAEPPGNPKNTGVGSLSLLQGIFRTQKSNRSLLHCRRILYRLSYQGSDDGC